MKENTRTLWGCLNQKCTSKLNASLERIDIWEMEHQIIRQILKTGD